MLMIRNEKSAFSERLIIAMLACPHASKSGTKHGVDVAALQAVASVTREMARRYVEGLAIPHPDTMRSIADWLNVRVGWLRDGELPVRGEDGAHDAVAEPGGDYLIRTEEIHDPVIRRGIERLILAALDGKVDKGRLEAALILLIDDGD